MKVDMSPRIINKCSDLPFLFRGHNCNRDEMGSKKRNCHLAFFELHIVRTKFPYDVIAQGIMGFTSHMYVVAHIESSGVSGSIRPQVCTNLIGSVVLQFKKSCRHQYDHHLKGNWVAFASPIFKATSSVLTPV